MSEAPKKYALAAPDPYIWGIYIMLLVVSVVELYSASIAEVSADNIYSPLLRHGRFLGAGLLLVLWLQNVRYVYFRKWAPVIAALALGLVLLSSLIGVEINGAQRALSWHGITVQPAELAKLAVVLLLTFILAKYQMPGGVRTKGCVMSALVCVVFCGCLWKDGLMNTILIFSISLAMFLISGMQWRKFWIIFGVFIAFGCMVYYMKYHEDKSETEAVSTEIVADTETHVTGRAATHKGRFSRWWRGVFPTDTIDDINRQEIFARFAQAHGGVIGNGPGNSRESSRLPLAFSDYIYSIVIEDTGLVGGIALMILYLSLIARAGWIANQCNRAFPALLIMGCAIMIVFQALIHMAIVTGLAPVSGQPLPLISKGGTSVIVMSAAIGIMLSVSRTAVRNGTSREIKRELSELPEELKSDNPMKL